MPASEWLRLGRSPVRSTHEKGNRHVMAATNKDISEDTDEYIDGVIDAIASSVNIIDRDEAARLVHTVLPHYRAGRLTWQALITACRFLYHGFDRYQAPTKAHLLREARTILRLGETAHTHSRPAA